MQPLKASVKRGRPSWFTASVKSAPSWLARGLSIWLTLVAFPDSQVVLLSATMPMDVLEVTKKFMRDPIRILVKKEELTLEGIRQFYINVEREVGASGALLSFANRRSILSFRLGFFPSVVWG